MTEKPLDCETIRDVFGGSLTPSCRPLGDGAFLVVSPLEYEDGDHPQVIVRELDDGRAVVEDFGTSYGRMLDRGLDITDSAIESAIGRLIRPYGLSVRDGALTLHEHDDEPLASAANRMIVAMLQIDALHHTSQTGATRFADEVLDWLRSRRSGLIVGGSQQVHESGRTYTMSGTIYRDLVEMENKDWTLLYTATSKTGLKSCHYAFSDIKLPWYRKVLIAKPSTVESHPSDLERLEEVCAVASFDDSDAVVAWARASDKARADTPHRLGPYTVRMM